MLDFLCLQSSKTWLLTHMISRGGGGRIQSCRISCASLKHDEVEYDLWLHWIFLCFFLISTVYSSHSSKQGKQRGLRVENFHQESSHFGLLLLSKLLQMKAGLCLQVSKWRLFWQVCLPPKIKLVHFWKTDDIKVTLIHQCDALFFTSYFEVFRHTSRCFVPLVAKKPWLEIDSACQ